jgi:hypothetical protein
MAPWMNSKGRKILQSYKNFQRVEKRGNIPNLLHKRNLSLLSKFDKGVTRKDDHKPISSRNTIR